MKEMPNSYFFIFLFQNVKNYVFTTNKRFSAVMLKNNCRPNITVKKYAINCESKSNI